MSIYSGGMEHDPMCRNAETPAAEPSAVPMGGQNFVAEPFFIDSHTETCGLLSGGMYCTCHPSSHCAKCGSVAQDGGIIHGPECATERPAETPPAVHKHVMQDKGRGLLQCECGYMQQM